MAYPTERKPKRSEVIQIYCMGNIKKYLQETTLHGFKYLADNSLNTWEKLFFFTAVVVCFVTVANLISNIYARWDSTPVIIGISPHPISILKIPLPAITLCNMNQVLKSKVDNYTRLLKIDLSESKEYTILKYLCYSETEFEKEFENSPLFKDNNMRIDNFVLEHAQPCSRMLLHCSIGSIAYNCSDLFQEVLTDEGLCCSFNTVHPDFLYKNRYNLRKDPIQKYDTEPVDWSPETEYPAKLPTNYYPRPVYGTGISMGVSLILNADLDEYYCSSTNGPGFKIVLSNPIETPHVKETGLTVPLGYETRFRLEAVRSESTSAIRSINRRRRQCVFLNEEQLLYYKYFTKPNCESECQAAYIITSCNCVPFNLPLIYSNTTICTMNDTLCASRSQRIFARTITNPCLQRCQTSCFDLSFLPNSASSPLAEDNYDIQSLILRDMPKEDLRKNIAVMHFYYRESVFHADLKNVYIGLTEFLSNTGGIMGLFMGFSFISIAEIVYFSFLRPIFKFVVPRRYRQMGIQTQNTSEMMKNKHWIAEEICKPRAKQLPLDVPN